MIVPKVSRDLIENILLCEPITHRGREKLRALGLAGKITPELFWGRKDAPGLWQKQTDLKELDKEEIIPQDLLLHSAEEYKKEDIETRRKNLEKRFKGEDGVSLIALKGVVGSGKSIETQRQIYDMYGAMPFQSGLPYNATPDAILIDTERSVLSVKVGSKYECPKRTQPLWLLCTLLLETLVEYIWFLGKNYATELKQVHNNIKTFFYRENDPVRQVSVSDELPLFEEISNWAGTNDVDWYERICKSIFLERLLSKPTELLEQRKTNAEEAKEDIKRLLWYLFLLSFCCFPQRTKIIAIDNIEDYIAVRSPNEQLKHINQPEGIEVSNAQIGQIYECLNQVQSDIETALEKYKHYVDGDFIPTVTLVLVVRRTTYSTFCRQYEGAYDSLFDGIFDITGDLRIEDIWPARFDLIWKKHLSRVCNEETRQFMKFANAVIMEGIDASGRTYPQHLMRLLSRGLRRTGHNISFNLYRLYTQLTSKSQTSNRPIITLTQFYTLLNEPLASRYMLRQALIEYYFRGQIYHTIDSNDAVGQRWQSLNQGHLGKKIDLQLLDKDGNICTPRSTFLMDRKINKIAYDDGAYVYPSKNGPKVGNASYRSYLRRILSVLAKEENTTTSECIAPEYQEVNLLELLKIVLPPNPTEQDFHYLAKLLLNACAPERGGDFSPFVLMQANEERIYKPSEDITFSIFLSKLWAQSTGDAEDKIIDIEKCKIRLSEGGFEFLDHWQASFTFFSALYCYNFTPLFFVKSKEVIIHIINRVYNGAVEIRTFYRDEAVKFVKRQKECGIIHDLNIKKLPDKYLREESGMSYSIDKDIKELHIRYLNLYKDHISRNYNVLGLSPNDRKEILSTIKNVIDKYNSADWGDQYLCF